MKNKEKIFISGAAGVIGSEILLQLSNRSEISVLAADKKSMPEGLGPNIKFWQGDLNTIAPQEIQEFAPTIFIHLAATFERSTESLEFWKENFENNIKLSYYLARIMSSLPSIKKIIFASSYLIYDPLQYQSQIPNPVPFQLKESSKIYPRNLVGMAKLSHEKELEFLNGFYGDTFKTLAVRIFRGYGRGSRDVISRWVRDLLLNKSIDLYNPEGIFDYIYAKDTAAGLLELALKSDLSGIVNLGSGVGNSVNDIVKILTRYFPEIRINLVESEPIFESSVADISVLKSNTEWSPKYKLEDGISEIIEFEKLKPGVLQIDKNLNILITSASRKVPLIRAIQSAAKDIHPGIKVIAGDSSEKVISRYFASDFWKMPNLEDANISILIENCLQNKIGLIIPTRDSELLFWSRAKEHFLSHGVEVLVSDEETLNKCLDKIEFHNFNLLGRNNPIPTSVLIEDLNKERRFVVKERFGSGSKNVGLALNYEKAKEFAKNLERPIFQEFIEGIEISADVWIIPDIYNSVILRNRILVVDGESQITQIFKDLEIESLILDLAIKLNIKGPAVIQAIIDKDRNIRIIECNPRIGGASTASNAAGSRVFRKMILNSLLKDNSRSVSQVEEIRNLVQIRVPTDEYFNDINL